MFGLYRGSTMVKAGQDLLVRNEFGEVPRRPPSERQLSAQAEIGPWLHGEEYGARPSVSVEGVLLGL
ncbi:hypothetical protein WDZ92_28305 [Nostoc sp. NIES-2111]